MFMLLYADDTTICSESAEGLHQALDALSDYCDKWSLRVNVDKTLQEERFEKCLQLSTRDEVWR